MNWRAWLAAGGAALPLWAGAATGLDEARQYLDQRRAAEQAVGRAFQGAVQRARAAGSISGPVVDREMASVQALDRAQQAALLTSLRALLGVQRWPGCDVEPTAHAETLIPELGFGMLDGLRYRCGPGADDLVVRSHLRLLDAWRAEPPRAGEWPLPRQRAAALASPPFYSRALDAGAAFEAFQPLPVTAPRGTSVAVALLGAWSQDVAPVPPSSVVATYVRGDQVVVLRMSLREPLPDMPGCVAVFQHFMHESEAHAQLAYRRCYTQGLAGRPELAAVVKLAQARLDALAAVEP